MTLGERISNKRKASGLSQEELGNIIGVTRQSIYKWENDQAVPELENLLQLSRVFEITVGWLVNEETGVISEDISMTDSLSEAARKISTSAEKANEVLKEHSCTNKRAAVCIIAVLLCAIITFGIKLEKLERKYTDLQVSVNDAMLYTQGKVDSVVNMVKEVISQYANVTAADDIEILGVDFYENTVSLRVYAKPKTYTQGMSGTVTVRSGDESFIFEAIPGNDKGFSADITVPLTDSIEICFEFESNGSAEIVKLAEYTGWYSYSFGEYEIDWPLPDTAVPLSKYCEVSAYNDIDFDFFGVTPFPELLNIDVILLEGDTVIARYERIDGIPKDAVYGELQNYTTLFFKRPDGITLNEGKTYTELLILTDQYGRILEKSQRVTVG